MEKASLFWILLLILFSVSGCKSIFHVELGKSNNQNHEATNGGLNVDNLPAKESPMELKLDSGQYPAVWKEEYKYGIPILVSNLEDIEMILKV